MCTLYNGWSEVKTMLQKIASTRECSSATSSIDMMKYDSDKTNGLQSRKILIIIIIMRKIASHKVFVA